MLTTSDLAPGLVLGENVRLGEDVVLGAHVVIHDGVEVGDGCTIQDGVVLGKTPVLAPTSSASREGLPALVLEPGVTVGAGASRTRQTGLPWPKTVTSAVASAVTFRTSSAS